MSNPTDQKLEVLATLSQTISDRAKNGSDKSYTSKLLNEGTKTCAKKFGEEAFELAIASLAEDEHNVISEAGDVLYHLLVLLQSRDVTLKSVMEELDRRTGQSGLEEKASRKKR